MSDNRIERSICQAIEIIANQKIARADFDRTKIVLIQQILDETNGKYLVRYQDSTFTAWSVGVNVKYEVGDAVLLLSPKGSTDAVQVIIGSASPTAKQYSIKRNNRVDYNPLGPNAISVIGDESFGLHSYSGQEYNVLYKEEKEQEQEEDLIIINQESLITYIKQGNAVVVSYDVETNLDTGQTGGVYGLQIDYLYGSYIETDQKDEQGKPIEKLAATVNTLTVDSLLLEGFPYGKRKPSKVEYGLVNIQPQKFLGIKEIRTFVRNFKEDESKAQKQDIFITNIKITGAQVFNLEEEDNYLLNIDYTENGNRLNSQISKVKLKAVIKIDGKEMTSTDGIQYYWFRENAFILSGSSRYYRSAGSGWEAITRLWGGKIVSGEDTYIISSNQNDDKYLKEDQFDFMAFAPQKVTKIKCIAEFNGLTVQGQTVVYNENITGDVKISSSDKTSSGDNRTEYRLGMGSPTFTCVVSGVELEETESLSYSWLVTPSNGKSYSPDVTGDKYQNFPVENIIDKVTISCGVNKTDGINETYIGTAAITIKNINQLAETYEVLIENSNQVFKYDQNGNSPAGPIYDTPQDIKPLSFTLMDPQGTIISYDQLRNNGGNVYWYIPKDEDNTLLRSNTDNQPWQGADQTTAANFIIYKNMREFPFSIALRYDGEKALNYIKLVITYKDVVLTAYTNFTFVKDGDPGTNGTDYVAKIVPKGGSTDRVYGIITKQGKIIRYFNDFGSEVEGLENQIYNSGQIIESDSVKWVCPIKSTDTTWISCSNGDLNKTTIVGKKFNPSNIVRTVTEINEKLKIYAEYPINFNHIQEDGLSGESEKYRFKIVPKTGFKYVKYNEDGILPVYDTTFPFEVFAQHFINDVFARMDDGAYICEWSVVEGSNLEIVEDNELPNNKRFVKPLDTFNGDNLISSVKVDFTIDEEFIGSLYLPIYMYINRYNHAALNDWDGNSIELGEESGAILTPQIGAGKKDDNNTFTGVFMGEVKTSSGAKPEVGLFGYNSGQRSIFLDAETGKAQFGVNGKGRIVIDPSKQQAEIYSDNYLQDKHNGAGMKISLSEPFIKFGSGKFQVDSEGSLKSTSGTIANWGISSTALTNGNVGIGQKDIKRSLFVPGSTQIIPARIWGGENGKEVFAISNNGWLYAKSGVIGNWNVSSTALTNGNVGLGQKQINQTRFGTAINAKIWGGSSGNQNFAVDDTGRLYARSGKIGGWTIGNTSLTAGRTIIDSDGTISNNGGNKGTWAIKSDGSVVFTGGKIGNIDINNDGISGTGWFIKPGQAHFTGLQINLANGQVSAGTGGGSGGISGGGAAWTPSGVSLNPNYTSIGDQKIPDYTSNITKRRVQQGNFTVSNRAVTWRTYQVVSNVQLKNNKLHITYSKMLVLGAQEQSGGSKDIDQ